MKLLALIPLLLFISCVEDMPTRSTIADANTIAAPNASGSNSSSNSNNTNTQTSYSLHPRCLSNLRCLYSFMPVYNQSSQILANYIGNKTGQANYLDPGLCVPTAAAMILKAVLDERDGRTQLNNSFLESNRSLFWYETVYQIGKDSQTDFINGGTSVSNTYGTFINYFSNTRAHKGFYLSMKEEWTTRATLSNQDFIELIKKKKPAFLIGVDALEKNEPLAGKTWYSQKRPGHALVIKGFDGDRLHIQDPWGMDHFARIQHENLAHTSSGASTTRSVFTSFSNVSGHFMGRNGSTHKIVLDEVMVISLD